jgi:formylmethanofuran dehydrogenase subunit E
VPEYDDDVYDDEDRLDELANEVVGSCDDCGGDVCADEAQDADGDLLCDQCSWWREH